MITITTIDLLKAAGVLGILLIFFIIIVLLASKFKNKEYVEDGVIYT